MRITTPRVTKLLLLHLVGLSIAYQATAAYRAGLGLNFSKSTLVPWLSLTPQTSWKFPWVYLTATYAEQNLFTLGIAAAALYFGGRYFERAWGEWELARFIVLLTLLPNLITSVLYVLAYSLTHSNNLANTSIQGSIAIQAGFLVAFKQLVPEHTVSLLRGAVRIRVKHFPAIFLLANTISGFVLFTDTATILSWVGFLAAWTYLRFYQRRPDDLNITTSGDNDVRGDASETFAFAYFWPDAVHAPIAAVADGIYNILVGLGVLPGFSAEEVQSSSQEARLRAEGGLPTVVDRTDATERRRAIALQALNERLAAVDQAQRPPSAPPMAVDAVSGNVVIQESQHEERGGLYKPEWREEQP